MKISIRSNRVGFGVAVLVCLGFTLAFNLSVGYAGDERNHLQMVEHQSESLDYASWEDWAYGSYRGHAYHLFSPAPYFAYVPFHWIQKRTDVERNRITRLGGSVYAIAQFWLIWLLVSELLGKNGTALLVTLAANLIPEMRHLHGYVNADSFTILMGTWAFYLVIRMASKERLPLFFVAGIGLAIAGLALGKPTAYPIAGVLLGVFLWRLRSADYSRREWLRRVGIVICIPIVLAGPFHLHVYQELGTGELMATATHMDLRMSSTQGFIGQLDPGVLELPKILRPQLFLIWMSTWGWVPWHGELPSWLLNIAAWLCVLGIAGAAFARRASFPVTARQTTLLALAPLIMLVTLAILAMQPGLEVQGRLLLPAGVSALVFVILGNAALLQRVSGLSPKRSISVVASFWIVLLSAGNLWLLFPDERFQRPTSTMRSGHSHALVREDLSRPIEIGPRDVTRLDMEARIWICAGLSVSAAPGSPAPKAPVPSEVRSRAPGSPRDGPNS